MAGRRFIVYHDDYKMPTPPIIQERQKRKALEICRKGWPQYDWMFGEFPHQNGITKINNKSLFNLLVDLYGDDHKFRFVGEQKKAFSYL